MFDDSDENTRFEPIPLGARQRVMPRRTFKAVASKLNVPDADCESIDDDMLVTEQHAALPPTDHMFVTERVRPESNTDEIATARVPRFNSIAQAVDERAIVTARVPRLPPPPSSRSVRPPLPPHIVRTNIRLTAQSIVPPPTPPVVMPVLPQTRLARLLSRFALPIGGAIVVALLALYLALPGRAHGLSAAANHIAPLGGGSGESPSEPFQLTSSVDEPPGPVDDVDASATTAKQGRDHVDKPLGKHRPRKILAVDASTPLGNLRPRKLW